MKVLVLGAGGPAGVNTCRALAEHHDVVAADKDPNHLVWCEPYAKTVQLGNHVDGINAIGADVVIPQPDSVTMWLADHQDLINAKVFLPDRRTIALCQDKFSAGLAWRRAGLRQDRVTLLDSGATWWPEMPKPPFWLRARRGAGAKAAILARSLAEAKHWTSFWLLRDAYMEFIVEEYLPGRDLAWSGIYYQGELVCSFARERLEYLYPDLTPEGLTGTPVRARIVHDASVSGMAEQAVLAVDETPHGIFSVDLREDTFGMPRPTEINAGRGFTTFGLWATQQGLNLLHVIVRLAATGDYFRYGRDVLSEGTELLRHIDCGSHVRQPVQ